MMTNKPDWDNAPEDAQFYSECHFRKHELGREFNWHAGKWCETGFDTFEWHKKRDDFEVRPGSSTPEWNGQGLPPVGTVCESYDADGWQRCVILAVDARGNLVVDLLEDGMVEANHDNHCYSFRPIKSDREKWIDKASGSVIRALGIPGNTEILGIIYDAGLAKLT